MRAVFLRRDTKLVGDIADALDLLRKVFNQTLFIAGVNGAGEGDFTARYLDFDLGWIDFMVACEKVTDLFFQAFIRAFVAFWRLARMAAVLGRGFAAPTRLALVVVSGLTSTLHVVAGTSVA